MFRVILGCILALGPRLILAQSSTATSSSAAPTVSVSVGAAGHLFTPENITANIGDIIEFRFYPLNHSVARAIFEDPCIPAEYHEGVTGFWSGFHPMQAILSQPPTFQIKINDTSPIFFYCSAPGACEDGMVGVINANSTQTLAIQKQFAHNATLMLSPGEPIPGEHAHSTASSTTAMPLSTSTSSSSVSAASISATSSPTTAPAAASSPALSTGAIAGIAIGGVAVLVLIGALIYLCGRQRTLGEILRQQQQPAIPPSYNTGSGHMSMLSPGYAPKMYHENDPLHNRFSNQTGAYDRSGADTESYRSRSPGVDEHGEVLPTMSFMSGQGRQVNYSPARAGSPPVMRPIPLSPDGRVNTTSSPMTPMMPAQEERTEYPNPLRTTRMNSQKGPHELAVETERSYLPYVQK